MSGFTRVSLLIAGGLAALGILFVVLASIMGFRTGEFPGTFQDGGFQFGPGGVHYVTGENIVTEEFSFPVEEIDSFDIDFGLGGLQIISGTGDSVNVTISYQEGLPFVVREENGTLIIDNTRDRGWTWGFFGMGSRWERAALTIEIPEGKVYNEFRLEVGAGEAEILANLQSEDMILDVGVGRILISGDIISDALYIDVGVGDLTSTDGRMTIGELTIDNGVGRTSLGRVDVLEGAKIDNGVGEVELALMQSDSFYSFLIDVGVGEVNVGTARFSGLGRTAEIGSHDGPEIEIDSGVGSVNVRFLNEGN